MSGTLGAVVVAFCGNLAIAVAKLVGAAVSGSASLLAEGLHSIVDTGNEVFLYLGLHFEQRRPVPEHPFGFGRERFFWSFMAAVFIFAGGAVVSLYEGVDKWRHPHAVTAVGWAFGILAFAFVAEGGSLLYSLRQASCEAGRRQMGLWRYLRLTRDSTLLTVVLEDSAALLGLILAATGLGLAVFTGDTRWDAAGSLAVGALLVVLAFVLGARNHALLIGKAAAKDVRREIEALIRQTAFVEAIRDSYTVQLAPDKLLLAAHLQVRDSVCGDGGVGRHIDHLERQLMARIPSLQLVFLEIEPPGREVR